MTATRPRVQQLHHSGATDGQVLVWDDTLGHWTPADPSSTATLDSLSDVDTTGAADGDVLTYDTGSGLWIPAAPTGGGSGGGGGATGIDDLTTFNSVWGSSPTTYDEEFDGSGSSLPSGWSWVNQGDATYDESLDLGSVFSAYTGGTTSGSANERHRMIVRGLPSESTWDAIAKIPQGLARVGSWHRIGLVLRNSSSGAYWGFWRSMEGSDQFAKVQINSWSAINTYGGSQPIDRTYTDFPRYFRIRRNSSTSYDFHVSTTGKSWFPILSAHDPSGVGPNQIGFGFGCNDSQGLFVDLDWFRVR